MAYGVKITTPNGEQLAMPGWSLNMAARPPYAFKGNIKIDLPLKGLSMKITNDELAEIRRQFEIAEAN